MLIRIIYVSSAVGPQTGTMTHAILQKSQAWNKANGITGVLCQGQGVFLQALEGERHTVTQLYTRICADQRHNNVEILHCESIAKRRYEKWSMAHLWAHGVVPIGWRAMRQGVRHCQVLASNTARRWPLRPSSNQSTCCTCAVKTARWCRVDGAASVLGSASPGALADK